VSVPLCVSKVLASLSREASDRPATRRDDALRTDDRIRRALEEHWRASESDGNEVVHAIYEVDSVLDYPQSVERFRGRAAISGQGGGTPLSGQFTVLRITGTGSRG
jgi:hypothetical protein